MSSEPAKSPAEERDEAVDRVREELDRLVRLSGKTQRAIEAANGFARGYLSQVLRGHVNLTARHIFGILFVLDVPPVSFFAGLFPDPAEADNTLSEIRERMDRYDSALKQLEDKGFLTPED